MPSKHNIRQACLKVTSSLLDSGGVAAGHCNSAWGFGIRVPPRPFLRSRTTALVACFHTDRVPGPAGFQQSGGHLGVTGVMSRIH